jgi:hypothetical protein
MKKRVMAAAILAAAAAILLGGCDQQGDDVERGWTYSVKDAPIYDVELPTSAITGVSGEVQLYKRGGEYDETLVVGTLTDGLLTFALPDTVPESKLTAYFEQFADYGTVDPLGHKVFFAMALEVYDDEQLLGELQLYAKATETDIYFLYSKEPLTVAVDDYFDIEAASGWNCILFSPVGALKNGSPPPDAKWVYSPVPPPYEEL